MTLIRNFSLAILILLFSGFTLYHHGWANYDQKKVLDYLGVIEESKYENPHATAKVKAGNKVWLVILAPTTRMEARGVKPEMLKAGKSIQVVGYPHKTVKNEMRAERIIIDGAKYELR